MRIKDKKSDRRKAVKIGLFIFSVIVCVIILVPLIVLFITSLKTNREITANPLALPQIPVWGNYIAAWVGANIGRYFFNTFSYCLAAVAVTIFVSATAAFAFAKMNLGITKFLYPLLLSGTAIPILSIIVPIYFMLAGFKMLNTFQGIVAVYVAISIPFAVLIMTASMKAIPDALMESAVIDGCSMWGVFFKIIFPLSKTSCITVGIITFIRLWNDFLIALILNQKSSAYTLAVGLKAFVGEHSIQYDTLSAGLILSVIPPIIIYLLLQESIVDGLMAGSVKG